MLKKYIRNDIERNHLNEFSETISFSGIKLRAVKNYQKFNKKYRNKNSDENGLLKAGMILTLREKELPIVVEVGEKVEVDGLEYEVIAIEKNLGMLKLDLERIYD
nr:MAG TPA: ATP-binding sugar transporter [Caudoviricetes sp.]